MYYIYQISRSKIQMTNMKHIEIRKLKVQLPLIFFFNYLACLVHVKHITFYSVGSFYFILFFFNDLPFLNFFKIR